MRNIFILVALTIVVATSAYAYTTGDWRCISGACTLGATTATSSQLIGGAESITVGGSNDTFLFTVDGTDTVTIIGADAAGAADLLLDTTGAGAITIGSGDVTGVTQTTDGASLNLEGTTAETLTLTATSTNTAIFQGADAAGLANTLFDTTGAGTITIGSADVTSIPVITDGGTLTIDGTISVTANAVSEISTAVTLVANTVHVASEAADHTLPTCNAGAVGNWVTVIVRDASEIISIVPDTGSTIAVPGTTTVLGADDELDSAATADDSGDFVTLICGAAAKWYGIAMGGVWTDGGAS